jgi:hypothetical protein
MPKILSSLLGSNRALALAIVVGFVFSGFSLYLHYQTQPKTQRPDPVVREELSVVFTSLAVPAFDYWNLFLRKEIGLLFAKEKQRKR